MRSVAAEEEGRHGGDSGARGLAGFGYLLFPFSSGSSVLSSRGHGAAEFLFSNSTSSRLDLAQAVHDEITISCYSKNTISI